MRTKVASLTILAVAALLIFTVTTRAQQGQADSASTFPNCCTVGHDPGTWQNDPKMHGQMMNMMHGMGMTAPMMQQCMMLINASLAPNDPASILSLKAELGLTSDQISKLDAIVAKAREEAAGLLTDQQRQTLSSLPATPATMSSMWQGMDKMMRNWHGTHPNDPTLCPSHMMMMMPGMMRH